MCWNIYIGSDDPLTLIPPDSAKPAFYVMLEEDEKLVAGVRHHLSQKYICFAGGASGCGCDFWSSAEERKHLASYLASERKQNKQIDVYICWAGSEAKDRVQEQIWDPLTLTAEKDGLPERVLLHLT